MKIDELIELLQKKRNELGNVRVVTILNYDYFDTHDLNPDEDFIVGYDICNEFMYPEEIKDFESLPEKVLAIRP